MNHAARPCPLRSTLVIAGLLVSAAACRPDDRSAAAPPASVAAPPAATAQASTTAEAPAATGTLVAPPTVTLGAGPQPTSALSPRGVSAVLRPTCTVIGNATAVPVPRLDLGDASISRKNLGAWIATLADCKTLKGRDSGSDEARGAARLLAKALAGFGIAGGAPNGEYCQAFEARGRPDQNVVARLSRGDGANRPVVIVGAHYDHLGRAGGVCYPGADDNASGVAALLEAARVLGRGEVSAGSDVVFVFFGAEERGLLGSKHYALHPTVPFGDVTLMVNVDMVGRRVLENGLPPSESGAPFAADTIGYVFVDPATTVTMNRAATSAGVQTFGVKKSVLTAIAGDYASDDDSFAGHTATVFLSTSIHLDYHQPTDTAAKVDVAQVERAAKLVLELVK